ncbi:MAG TPA: hypothetical protein DDZ51_27475 [Planctomycetaceae bacterium]|nr:hypothetical protein [Planctomycetaceae bacterium]
MFGLRRSSEPGVEPLDWAHLRTLLDDDGAMAALEHVYPNHRHESFLAALQRIEPALAGDLIAAGNRLQSATQLIQHPVVAVAGMLNSGKTSLVSSFLSRAGRERTLRGVSNAQGTHRFVLWLPQRWKAEPELWGLLLTRLTEALGSAPEALGETADEAHRQYNNRGCDTASVSIPLIATDPALDDVGIALLDCPDIVSDASLGLGSPEQRRQLLGRAATLCSAFLVVASAEQSRDTTLGDMMRIAGELMPGVPRLLAVNKVRPKQQSAAEVYETFLPLMRQNQIDKIYAAYDFDVRGSESLIPSKLHNSVASPITRGDELPIFFSLSQNPDLNPPGEITPDRLLGSLPMQLDRGQMFERFRAALETNLRVAVWEKGRGRIAREVSAQDGQAKSARRCMLDVGLEVFAIRGDSGEIERLRLHQSKRIVDQLTAAFAMTAPWYARWSVGINTRYRRVLGGAGDWFRKWLPTQALDDKVNEVKGHFKRGDYGSLMTPERLRAMLRQHAEAHPIDHWKDDSPWEEACRTAIHRYDRDDFTALDPYELERACSEMWSKVSWTEKGKITTIPLVVVFSTFAAVLMLPIDGGGTAVLASASISELLAAGGLAAAAAVWAGGKTAALVEQQAAKQQLIDFVAVLCDTFGVARSATPLKIRVGKAPCELPTPKITLREPIGPTLTNVQWNASFEPELRKRLLMGDGA